jgi:hypothetical protein
MAIDPPKDTESWVVFGLGLAATPFFLAAVVVTRFDAAEPVFRPEAFLAVFFFATLRLATIA